MPHEHCPAQMPRLGLATFGEGPAPFLLPLERQRHRGGIGPVQLVGQSSGCAHRNGRADSGRGHERDGRVTAQGDPPVGPAPATPVSHNPGMPVIEFLDCFGHGRLAVAQPGQLTPHNRPQVRASPAKAGPPAAHIT